MTSAHVDNSYCIFEVGDTLFGIAAEDLREVTLRPTLAPVPHAAPVLAGLWHEGSAFLPVLRLPIERPTEAPERNMLVVRGPNSPWGLLVEQVHGIEPLPVQAATGGDGAWASAVTGAAHFEQRPVQVVTGAAIYRLAEEQLMQASDT